MNTMWMLGLQAASAATGAPIWRATSRTRQEIYSVNLGASPVVWGQTPVLQRASLPARAGAVREPTNVSITVLGTWRSPFTVTSSVGAREVCAKASGDAIRITSRASRTPAITSARDQRAQSTTSVCFKQTDAGARSVRIVQKIRALDAAVGLGVVAVLLVLAQVAHQIVAIRIVEILDHPMTVARGHIHHQGRRGAAPAFDH